MRKKLKIIAAAAVIIVVAVVMLSLIKGSGAGGDEETADENAAGDVIIPDVAFYLNDVQIADPCGYTAEMDAQAVRDDLAVIDGGLVNFKITTNGAGVETVSYQIRDLSSDNLLDDGEISDFIIEDGVIDMAIGVTSVVQTGSEYILILILETDAADEIFYYVRITEPAENLISDQIEFALEINELTFMHEDATDLYYYLESDSDFDNTNLGYVTIEANFDQITWGSLDPDLVTEPVVSLKEINDIDAGVAATFELNYRISTGDEGEETFYDVAEDITVWTYYDTMHILGYERTVEEIFEATDYNTGTSTIYLGISEDTDALLAQSDDGGFVIFESGDSLWMIDISGCSLKKIYSHNDGDCSNCEIVPVSVDDEGNAVFAALGYCALGEHAGKCGISVLSYSPEDELVTEDVFLVYDKSYEVLKNETGDLFYVNDGVFYMILGGNLIYVNTVTVEYDAIVCGLSDGNFAVNEDGNYIAYNTDMSEYDSDSMTVLCLDTMQASTIEAGEGNKIRVLGYSGNNLVYGIAKESKITQDDDGGTVFKMSEVDIVDEENNLIKSYSEKKVYITDVEISSGMINLKRIKGGEQIDDDQLIDNTEKTEAAASVIEYTSSTKKTIAAIELETSFSQTPEMESNVTASFEAAAESVFNLEVTGEESLFYVYGGGDLKGIYNSKKEAKAAAKEHRGSVIDETGEKIWVFEENYGEE